jgi:hypothetical protein
MSLLRADRAALVHLFTRRLGRRHALGLVIGHLLLALMSWWFARTIAARPSLLAMIHRQASGDSLTGLCGYGLLAGPLVAGWLGLSLAQRQLFDAPEMPLWRSAPLPRWRPAAQVLLRAGFACSTWAAALAAPFLWVMLQRAAQPTPALLLLPLAVLAATLPLLAVLMAGQIVLMRFFAGRWLRLVFALLSALMSVGFMSWFLLTVLAPDGAQRQQVARVAADPMGLPWTVDCGARLLANAATGRPIAPALLTVAVWLLGSAFAFVAIANLHPAAAERHLAAQAPLWRGGRRHLSSRPWLAIAQKELCQVLQQPGALLGFLLFALLVVAMVMNRVLVSGILADAELPRPLAHLGALLTHWFLAVMLVLYAHMGRLVSWDGPQWPLWMQAPVAPRRLLFGKLFAVGLLLLWPLFVVGSAGAWAMQVERATLLTYCGVAAGGTLLALGVLAVIGTLPRLLRPDDGGQVLQGARGFLAALLLVVTFELAVAPAVIGFVWLRDRAHRSLLREAELLAYAPWLVATAIAAGSLFLLAGSWLGSRHLRRLLLPRE